MQFRKTALFLLIVMTGCSKLSFQPPTEKPPDSRPSVQCPTTGGELELCDGSKVKLVAADFYRSIGKEDLTITSSQGAVFCVLQLEWIGTVNPAPPVPDLINGNGLKLSYSAPALAAFLAMQPADRFMDRSQGFQQDRLEAVVFELDDQAATTGLFISWPTDCGKPSESSQFCLGKYRFGTAAAVELGSFRYAKYHGRCRPGK
jgi:hypothetical protein